MSTLFKKLITSNNACGCGKPKPDDIYQPTPLPKPDPTHPHTRSPAFSSSSTSDPDRDCTSTTFSAGPTTPYRKISLNDAVFKDSNDPYADFRQSMLQMILEREIYTKDELKELLNCFLELNSPVHHEIIVRAFMEIWNGVMVKR